LSDTPVKVGQAQIEPMAEKNTIATIVDWIVLYPPLVGDSIARRPGG
jgi:hypothetical protein